MMRMRDRKFGSPHVIAIAGVIALTACSSAPVHFYTLSSGQLAGESSSNDGKRASTSSATFAIDVLPVAVPAGVAMPQLVVRDSAQSMLILEHERWSAPLQDEIRAALAADLSHALGAVDASRISGAHLPTYRVRVDIQRFDARLGQAVSIDAVWSVTLPGTSDVGPLCPAQLVQSADAGYAGLVAAYQQALAAIGQRIALSIRASAAHQKSDCGATQER